MRQFPIGDVLCYFDFSLPSANHNGASCSVLLQATWMAIAQASCRPILSVCDEAHSCYNLLSLLNRPVYNAYTSKVPYMPR